ncbi:ribosome hibernation factor-recruiting GTPase MRF [Geodermatophilus sp. SYSU D01106]
MSDRRTPVVLVPSLSRHLGATAVRTLLDRPGTVVVHHDVGQLGQGVVVRTVLGPGPGRGTTTALELAHGCLSCTLRLDLLPLLRDLAGRPDVDRVVLHLDPALEPEHLCWAIEQVVLEDGSGTAGDAVRVETVLAVVDAATWLDDATGGEELADRGLAATAEDDRTLAQVAVDQVAFADAVLVAGEAAGPWEELRLAAVLDRLVPGVPRAGADTSPEVLLAAVPDGARRGRTASAHDPLLPGQPPLHEDAGVRLVRIAPRRPLHPGRLHDALDVLLDGVVCSRGRLWLATRHDRAVWLESAGQGLRVADAGPWLAALDDPAWDEVDAERRVAAALRWHPLFGDRHTEVVVLTHRRPGEEIVAALAAAQLTDDELALGPDGWRDLPDPFGGWHEDPCEASTPADDDSTHATTREEHS